MVLNLQKGQAVLDELENAWTPLGLVTDALRLDDHFVEGHPSEAGVLHRECEWHISTLLAHDFKVGDIIGSFFPAINWIVQEVIPPVANDCWILLCRQASVTADATLRDTVTLYPAVYSQTEYGSTNVIHTATHPTFIEVAAKIQLRPSTTEDMGGQREFLERYDIYVADELPQLFHGDIIKDGTVAAPGKTYLVTSWRNREDIKHLSVIECQLRARP